MEATGASNGSRYSILGDEHKEIEVPNLHVAKRFRNASADSDYSYSYSIGAESLPLHR